MPWDEGDRLHWRAALRVHHQLIACRGRQDDVDLPVERWTALARTIARCRESRRRLWPAASRQADEEAARALSELSDQLQRVLNGIRHRRESLPVAGVPDLWLDLRALREEFEEVEVDLKAREVRATTESIVLEGVDLGPFRIVLGWASVGQRHPYHVEALEPNPAESNSDVQHPHLNDGILCEGDGQYAIRRALEQGRLLDFFVVVRQVLSTYNRDSAYVKLEVWHGSPCQSCGYLADPEDAYTCAACRDCVCADCCGGCATCCDSVCHSCLADCPFCENDRFCPSCLTSCGACGRGGCDRCLREGDCPDCLNPEPQDEEEPDHADDEPNVAAAPAGAAV